MKITGQLCSRSKRSTSAAPAEEVLVRVVARGMYHTDLHAFAGMTTPKLRPEIGGQAFSRCQLAGTACQPVLHWLTYG
jgi:D-arabinose 1-dehydrogenase-like Zn-dependent alcohol dehydrogenase